MADVRGNPTSRRSSAERGARMRRMRKARRTGGLPWYDADVDLVAAAQEFHGNDVFQHAAVIHILSAKAREAEALVDKVVFVFRPQVPLPDVLAAVRQPFAPRPP